MTILYINNEHCTSIAQLIGYFVTPLSISSAIYYDLLDCGRYGDIAQWLREIGEDSIAKKVESINTDLSDSEYINQLGQAITGQKAINCSKPEPNKCFKLARTKQTKKGNDLEISLSFKILMSVNENYEIILRSNWGTRAKQINPSEYNEGEVVDFVFDLRKRPGVEFGTAEINVEGYKEVFKINDSIGGNEHEVITYNSQEKQEPIMDSSFLYLINKTFGVFEILNKDGSKVNQLEAILIVDYRFQSDMPPYLLGLNTADDKLYFISPKQIFCIEDWDNGKLYTSLAWENPQLCKYSHRSSFFEKEVILEDDFKTFCIKDKFDYSTYYSVENGVCKRLSERDIRDFKLQYTIDDSEDIPISVSTITGEKIRIPGFKANIYLGNDNGVDIFWAAKKCVPGQYRFKESFIVDFRGNILRYYEYDFGLSIGGKYILNASNGRFVSISSLNGREVIKVNFDLSDLNISSSEVEPNIFKFSDIYNDSYSWFWLVKENVFCEQYNKDFYCVPTKNYNYCIYRRSDNYLIGITQSNLDNSRHPDDIYYAEFNDNFENRINRLFFKNNGDTIYQLKDNESTCMVEDPNKAGCCKVCGVSENRIIVNVDNRFYKILDYNGNEVTRVDFSGISDSYHYGKLLYYNGTELGYYDYDGVKHLINYKTREYIIEIKAISSNFLLVKHKNKNVIVDLNGNVIIKAETITPYLNHYIDVRDKNYNRFIYDNACKKLRKLDSGDKVLILE